MGKGKVLPAIKKSLKDWQFEYFDLYLIHWPFCFKTDEVTGSTVYDSNNVAVVDTQFSLEDTWREMEALVEAGLAKSIGVSNFSVDILKRILAIPGLKVKPAVDQVELHPYLPQTELRQFCETEGIVCEAYSSLGSGKAPSLLEDPTVLKVASALNIPAGSVLLSWARQKGIPVIPKSGTRSRVVENFNHHTIPENLMAELDAIAKRHRYVDPLNFWGHPMP